MNIRHLTLILVTVFFMAVSNCYAQSNGFNLTGKVMEKSASNGQAEPINLATVKLVAANDSTMRHITATNADGVFTIKGLETGIYHMSISCMGYEDSSQEVSVDGNTDMGIIGIEISTKMLDEVTVVANYTKIKPNGTTVFQVKGNPLVKGKSTMGFMRYIRGLDITDNSVSVNGRENTLIYLENREISFDELKALSPDMISRIEIIPFADATYGVNAAGGVVKIFLRQEGGLIGTASLNGEADDHGLVHATPRVNLLYTNNKLSVNNNLRFGKGKWRTKSEREYTSTDNESTTTTAKVRRQKYISENLSLRYKFNNVDRIDVYGGIHYTDGDLRQNMTGQSDLLGINTTSGTWDYSGGVQIKKGLSKNGKSYFLLKAEYMGNNENSDEDYLLSPVKTANYDTHMNIVSIEPYAKIQISKNSNLKVGLWYEYLNDKHDNMGFESDDVSYITDARYNHKGKDYETWAEYNHDINKSLSLRFALKYHGTETEHEDHMTQGNSFSNYQDGIYPEASGTWTINGAKMRYLSIGYRRYYSLPNYNYYSPVVTYQSENLYSIGDPDLKKEMFDDVELTFSLNRAFSASYRINHRFDMLSVMMHEDENKPGTYYTKPENSGFRLRHILNLRYRKRFMKWWYSNNRLSAEYRNEKASGIKTKNTYASFSSNNDFSISNNFGLTLGMLWDSPNETAAYRQAWSYSLDFGAYATLLKGMMSIELTGANLFYNRPTTTMKGNGWTVKQRNLTPATRLQLSVFYSFTAGRKIKNQSLPSIGTTDRLVPTL